jgi:hypothetical protein
MPRAAVEPFAAAIAARLQDAHERRRAREQERDDGEDKDMIVDENTNPELRAIRELNEKVASVWDDDPFVHACKLAQRLEKVLADIAASGHAPDEPQASAVSAERVVELEKALADAQYNAESFRAQAESASRAHEMALERIEGLEAQLFGLESNVPDGAYVQHDVPWDDVAAGMMTISATGAPFLAEEWIGVGAVRLRGLHDGKVITFEKAVDASKGETVKVLVPYVAPGAAEREVAEQLGGQRVDGPEVSS